MPDFSIKLVMLDLTSKDKTLEVDLTNVAPQGERFATGIAVDKDGNIYITDSFASVIYLIDKSGQATYLSDPKFGSQSQFGQDAPTQGNPPQGTTGQGNPGAGFG